MDNYQNEHPDADDTMYCKKCGVVIEDVMIFAPDTEYETEVEWCEKCYENEIKNPREL